MDRPIDVNTRCSATGPYWTRQNDVQGDTEIRPTCHLVGVLDCDLKELGMVGLSVSVTTDAQEKKQTEQEVEEMANIYGWCQCLYLYVHWKEDVINKSLLRLRWHDGSIFALG